MREEKFKNCIWHGIPVLAIVLWGLLCVTDHLWYDEAYSAALILLPYPKMLYITAVDAHSPFYYTLLRCWFYLWGAGTRFFALKLFSLLFMAGYLMLAKYFVRRLFDLDTSVYMLLFSLCMPIMSVQAGNVRMYATALFFATLMGLMAYELLRAPTKKKWVIFGIASIGTVYCHTFAMILAFWFYVLFGICLWRKRRELLKSYFVCGAAVAFCFLPWLFVTFRQMALRMKYDTGSVQERATLRSLQEYAKEWFSALETPIPLVVWLGLLLFLLLGAGALLRAVKEKQALPLMGFGALALTALTGFVVSVFVNNCFLGRYVFPGFGFLMLFYAVGVQRFQRGWQRGCIVGAFVLCFCLQYASELSLEYDDGLETYQAFIRQVEPQDLVLSPYAHTSFLSVYHPDRTFYIDGYKPYKMPFANVEELTDHGALSRVEGTIYDICFAGSPPQGFDGYRPEEFVRFHYMYYDFVIWRLRPVEGTRLSGE